MKALWWIILTLLPYANLFAVPGAEAQNWLVVRELDRVFDRGPRRIDLFAPAAFQDEASHFRRILEQRGFAVEWEITSDSDRPMYSLAGMISRRPVLDASKMVVVLDSEGWQAPVSALLARNVYGPSVVLALQASAGGQLVLRSPLTRTAREHDMAVLYLPDIDPQGRPGEALARAVLSLSAPHPAVHGLLAFPALSLALLWLRRRSH